MNGSPGEALVLVGLAVLGVGLAADLPAALRSHALGSPAARRAWRGLLAGGGLALVLAAASWLALALPIVTLLAGAAGASLPFLLGRARVEREARECERAWGAALDQLADALESGLAFSAAAAFVGSSGPVQLRARFGLLAERIRRGELDEALEAVAAAPEQTARAVAALLRAALVELPTGGLAPLLRELARVSRERFETRERARVRALALRREASILAASPLCFLLLIGWSAPGYLDAYRSGAGTVVSLAGALAIGLCYLAMLRLGRIPEPGRQPRQ
jgi:tight adherence protein B